VRTVVLFLALICPGLQFNEAPSVKEASVLQTIGDRIAELLEKLSNQERTEGDGRIALEEPSTDVQKQVRARLIDLARESSEGRASVIKVLIEIVDDPGEEPQFGIAHRWVCAADVLGAIKAEEAVDVLVRNIRKEGMRGIGSNSRPAAFALAEIDKPAIPRLIKALSNEDKITRMEAANVLVRIGESAVPALYDTLLNGEPSLKAGAALALGWMGGMKARLAIEQAIEIESDDEVKRDLQDSLKEMRRYWGEN